MLNKIIDSKTAHEFVEEARAMVKKYGWEEKTVRPWEKVSVKVTEIIDQTADYDNCSYDSKLYLQDYANGLVNILNKWEEFENEPKVKIMYNGKTLTVTKSIAEDLVRMGAIIVEEDKEIVTKF